MPGKRIVVAALLLVLLVEAFAAAAKFDTDIVGEVVAIEGTVITIKEMQGQLFRAETARSGPDLKGQKHTYRSECLIEVTGQEFVKNLQPGLALQIECRLANRRVLVGEVKKLSLITANVATQVGVVVAELVEDEAAEDSEKPSTRQLEDCVVVGQLVKNKNGNLTIAYAGEKGSIELFIRLAPDDKVEVLGSNLSVVSPGDKIRAKGYTHGLPHFFAREVEVEHLPLVEAKNRPPVANRNEVARNKNGAKQKQEPFELADPEEAAKAAAANQNGKVKLQIIKVN